MKFCPQCEERVDEVYLNRLIQDACGHKKCRQCLLNEENGCRSCSESKLKTSETVVTGSPSDVEKSLPDPNLTHGTRSNRLHDSVQAITILENVVSHQTQYEENSSGQTQLPMKGTCEMSTFHKKKIVPKKCTSRSANISKCKVKRKPLLIPGYVTISDSTPKFTCTLCKKSFTTRLHIRYHSYCNGTSKPFKCDKCNQEFITKSHYQYHIRNHEGSRPYVCNKCGKSYNQQGKLTRHSRSHLEEKTFVCSTCGHRFKNLDGLKSHSKIHSGIKPHHCTLCNKRFSELANLKKHAIAHRGEKNFMCDECGKSFGSKSALNAHIHTHSKIRPHVCNACGRAFTSRKDLKRHSTIHLSLKPFNCQLCNQAFRRKDNFDRHMKNTHPESCLPAIIQPLPKVPNYESQPIPSADKDNPLSVAKQSTPACDSKMDSQISKSGKRKSDLESHDFGSDCYPNGQLETHPKLPNYTLLKLNNINSHTMGQVTKPSAIVSPVNHSNGTKLDPGTEAVSQNDLASITISAKNTNIPRPQTAICQAVPVINRNTANSPNQQNNVATSSIIKMGTSLARTAFDGTNCVRTITCTSNVQRTLVPPNVPTIVSPINMKQTDTLLKVDNCLTNQDQVVAKEVKSASDSVDYPPKPKLRLYLSDLHWRKRTMELLNLRNELKADSLVYDKSLEKVDDMEEETNLNNPVTHSERIEFCNSPKNNNPDDHGTYYSKQTFYKVSDQPGEILVRGTQQKYLPHNRLRHIHPKSIDYHEPHQQSAVHQRMKVADAVAGGSRVDHLQAVTKLGTVMQQQPRNATAFQANNVIVENKTGNVRPSQ